MEEQQLSLLRLSARLKAIAELVPDGIGAADVGTDHGYIPVWLAQNGYGGKLYATDIKKEPLRHAKQTAAEYGQDGRIEFHLCNGLSALKGKNIDTVVIAGMGGENIASILEAAPWTRENSCFLILQPMSKSAHLRKWLYDNGFRVLSEQLVDDSGIYEILTASAGTDEPYSPAELLIGHTRIIASDPLYEKRLAQLTDKIGKEVSGLSVSLKSEALERLTETKKTLLSLQKLKSSGFKAGD